MKQASNWNEIEKSEVVEFNNLGAGIYHAQIKTVEDVTDKEYLKITFDFVDGDFKGEGARLEKEFGKWSNTFTIYKSYKENATKFFKAFITAIEKTNKGYIWNWDEKTLVGKYFVAVMGEEEYQAESGEIKVSVKCVEQRSFEAEKNGDIKVPELKKLKVVEQKTPEPVVADISDDDLPF